MKKLFPLLLIIISFGYINAQPFIALGMSRSAVLYNMEGDQHWSLHKPGKSELIYVNDTSGVAFTYRFLKDFPGLINRTCVEMIADFPDSLSKQSYIDQRLSSCRLRETEHENHYTLNTDLYDLTIHVYSVGSRRLIIKY